MAASSESLSPFYDRSLIFTLPIIAKWSFSAAGALGWGQDKGVGVRCGNGELDGEIEGDVFTVKAECLDVALWKISGAAVVLRLVQLASVSLLLFHFSGGCFF